MQVTSHRTREAKFEYLTTLFHAFSAKFRQTLSYISKSLLVVLILRVESKQVIVSVKIRIPGKILPASSGNYVTQATLNKISEQLTSFSLHKIRLFRSQWFLVSFLSPGSPNK